MYESLLDRSLLAAYYPTVHIQLLEHNYTGIIVASRQVPVLAAPTTPTKACAPSTQNQSDTGTQPHNIQGKKKKC